MASATANPPQASNPQNRGGVLPKAQELLDAGWECIGDPNEASVPQWLDPTLPAEETITEEPKFGWVKVANPDKRDAFGHPVIESVWKQLYGQDGTETNRVPVPIRQARITCPAQPMTLIEAAMLLRERKLKAKKAAEQKQKQTA